MANRPPEVRREHRNDGQHHPFGTIAGVTESLDDLQPLRELLALRFARGLLQIETQLLRHGVHIDVTKHLQHGLAAHSGFERVIAILVEHVVVAVFGEDLPALERRVLRIEDDVALTV